MPEHPTPHWRFLTNHAQVLVCVAHDPGVRLREISERVGITERAAHRIVDELATSGYIRRERVGRRNRYTIQADAKLPDLAGRVQRIGELLAVLVGERSSAPAPPGPERATRAPSRRRRPA